MFFSFYWVVTIESCSSIQMSFLYQCNFVITLHCDWKYEPNAGACTANWHEGDMILVSEELNCIGRAFYRKSILAKNEAAFIIFVFYHFIQKATNSRYIFSSISQVHIWSRMKKIGVWCVALTEDKRFSIKGKLLFAFELISSCGILAPAK